MKVYYICDRKKCGECYPDCNRTTDHKHALHKDYIPDINKLFANLPFDDVTLIEKEKILDDGHTCELFI